MVKNVISNLKVGRIHCCELTGWLSRWMKGDYKLVAAQLRSNMDSF